MVERADVLVVGASVAAGALIGQLRDDGHTGRILVVDKDPDAPYDRPPLSKEFLRSGDQRPEAPWWSADCELVHAEALGLDAATRTVLLRPAGGSVAEVVADHVVIATGSAPIRLPGQPDGVTELRTAADARALRELARGGDPVAVLGAGTVGTELTSSLIDLGAAVTLVDIARHPLQRFFGGHLGDEAAEWIRGGGADLRLGERVAGIHERGPSDWLVETDRSRLTFAAVVSAVGTRPVVGWLHDSGLTCVDGIACDADGAALDVHGSAIPGVHAAGDVAHWRGPLGAGRRREDWTSAQRQARHVARRIAGLDPLPGHDSDLDYFWTNQFGRRIQVLGTPTAEGTLVPEVVDAQRSAGFWSVTVDDAPVAWISINRPREFALAMRQSMAGRVAGRSG